MALVRHGSGARAAGRALASQVHPVFMLPPLAASGFGSVLAGGFDLGVGLGHLAAIFLAVYTAHVKDGYVDFHRRGEDDDHPLTAAGCRVVLAASTAGFGAALVGLWLAAGPRVVALTAPTWVIAYLHAPHLDMRPVTATAGYPVGVALALLGGLAAQGGAVDLQAIGFAAVFVLLLSGVKVVDDAVDVGYDRTIDKRTVAVTVGLARSRRLAHGLMAVALVGTAGLAAAGVFPVSSAAAPVAFAAVLLPARRADAELATMLLIRGAYVFFAVLVFAVWFRPLG